MRDAVEHEGLGIVGRRRPDLDRHSFVPPRTPRYAHAAAHRVRPWSVPERLNQDIAIVSFKMFKARL